jgi:hypothetical protein
MKRRKYAGKGILPVLTAIFALVLVLGACDNGSDTETEVQTAVTFNSVTANGSSSQTTTQLTLTFSQAITGLSAADITLSGVSGVTKGTLSGSGPAYTLGISGFTSGGTLSVAVAKSGYTVSDSPKTAAIYYYSSSGGGDTAVTFNSVTANGSSSQTTTQLTLTFSQAITGLSAADITLSGVSGVTKGTLSGSGPAYTLGISGFTSGGTLNVAVAKSGYTVSGSPKTVTIYYYGGQTSSGKFTLTGASEYNGKYAILIGIGSSTPLYGFKNGGYSGTTLTFEGVQISSGTVELPMYTVNTGGSTTNPYRAYTGSGTPMAIYVYILDSATVDYSEPLNAFADATCLTYSHLTESYQTTSGITFTNGSATADVSDADTVVGP